MSKDSFDGNIHDITHKDMLTAIREGHVFKVVDNLARRHPAIAVAFIIQAAQDGTLVLAECNVISNLLMDKFTELRDTKGLQATERFCSE